MTAKKKAYKNNDKNNDENILVKRILNKISSKEDFIFHENIYFFIKNIDKNLNKNNELLVELDKLLNSQKYKDYIMQLSKNNYYENFLLHCDSKILAQA